MIPTRRDQRRDTGRYCCGTDQGLSLLTRGDHESLGETKGDQPRPGEPRGDQGRPAETKGEPKRDQGRPGEGDAVWVRVRTSNITEGWGVITLKKDY